MDDNLDLYQKIVDSFNFVDCIQLLEVYPDLSCPMEALDLDHEEKIEIAEEREVNLRDIFSIIMALVEERSEKDDG